MKRLNNKGYMLVEIIMAFVITFGLLYFMMDLVLNIKNKNDDLLVETIVRTDQTIITNRLMEYVMSEKENFDCSSLNVDKNTNVVKYGSDNIDVVDDYAILNNVICNVDKSKRIINIKIPIDVKQMENEDFDVVIDYKYDIEVAYAIYSDTDNSLRFYKNFDFPSVGSTYNGLTVTAIYTGFEIRKYNPGIRPWYSYREDITSVVFENVISPISTYSWFLDFKNCNYFDVNKLNMENVTDMSQMFYSSGRFVDSYTIVGMDGWTTSNVTDMSYVFRYAGYDATEWNIGNIGGWDTSNVTRMQGMFYDVGYNAKDFDIGDLSGWDTSRVTDMSNMFQNVGYNATEWSIGDLSNWDVSNVIIMNAMFDSAGYNAKDFNIGNIGGWDVSKVKNMGYMFNSAGYNAVTFNIGDLFAWDTSSVTDVYAMFMSAGYNAAYILDLSSWNVDKVTSYGMFNANVNTKIVAPVWVN